MPSGTAGVWASRWLGRASADDTERRIAALIFRARYGVLVLLAAAALTLPAVHEHRLGLAATALLVGVPFNFLFDRYQKRTGRVPAVMAWSEAILPAVVAWAFPVAWTPMLLLVMGNLALHAVLYRRHTALVSTVFAATAFSLSGWAAGPDVWSLGVVTLLLYGVATSLAVEAVAERERSTRGRFTALIDGVDAALFEVDPATGRFTYISHQIEDLLGYTPSDWLSAPRFWLDHVHADDTRRCVRVYTEALDAGRDFELEFRMVAADGRVVWFHARVNVEADAAGRPVHWRGVAVDITERRRAEEALRHQALHDSLTGLPNRVLLQDRLRHAVAAAERSSEPVGLLIIDLDQFKEINDTLGHDHGDRLLQQIGGRLQRVLRDHDMVARLGGDEFAIILPGADRLGAEVVAEKIETALEQPFPLEDMTVQARASVGIALFPDQGTDAETLVQRADVAMYVAKRKGGGFAVYHPRDDRFSVRRLALIGELRRALECDELELFFQPKLDVRSREIIGVESLVRWRHPDYGLLGPERFIALAEVSGLIQQVTLWVLDRALRQCRAWMNAGIELAIAVNISARDLHDLNLPERLSDLLARWSVPAEQLVVEITEHEIMRDRVQAAETLGRLASMGVRVSIDDFGTGYSSLADLRHLPIDEIKIDRSFVADMATDVNDAVIVRSIVDLGHNLGINVVAEGVENEEICSWLDELGCDEIQGFHICHPLPSSELRRWLESRHAAALDLRLGGVVRAKHGEVAQHGEWSVLSG